MNDADSAAAVAAAPAVRHWVLPGRVTGRPDRRSRFHVSTAALTGNSQTAAASELSVYAVVGAAPVS